jgi:endonuclease-3
LSHLADLPAAEALAYLTTLPGVGHKTASIVLLFCFNGAAFPSTPISNGSHSGIGLSGRRASPEKIKQLWEQLLPPSTFYPLHLNLIQHGRRTCQALTPRCTRCPLQSLCDYDQQSWEWHTESR